MRAGSCCGSRSGHNPGSGLEPQLLPAPHCLYPSGISVSPLSNPQPHPTAVLHLLLPPCHLCSPHPDLFLLTPISISCCCFSSSRLQPCSSLWQRACLLRHRLPISSPSPLPPASLLFPLHRITTAPLWLPPPTLPAPCHCIPYCSGRENKFKMNLQLLHVSMENYNKIYKFSMDRSSLLGVILNSGRYNILLFIYVEIHLAKGS